MNASSRRIAASAAAAFLVLLTLLGGAYAAGMRLNVTPSVPSGLYLKTPLELQRGALVMACLDPMQSAVRLAKERHYLPDGGCPGGLAPVLKPIAGLPGDQVTQTPAGLEINGHLLPGTVARPADPMGRPLPSASAAYVVPAGSVLLAVANPASFDGRYFGPIPLSSVESGARPFLLF